MPSFYLAPMSVNQDAVEPLTDLADHGAASDPAVMAAARAELARRYLDMWERHMSALARTGPDLLALSYPDDLD